MALNQTITLVNPNNFPATSRIACLLTGKYKDVTVPPEREAGMALLRGISNDLGEAFKSLRPKQSPDGIACLMEPYKGDLSVPFAGLHHSMVSAFTFVFREWQLTKELIYAIEADRTSSPQASTPGSTEKSESDVRLRITMPTFGQSFAMLCRAQEQFRKYLNGADDARIQAYHAQFFVRMGDFIRCLLRAALYEDVSQDYVSTMLYLKLTNDLPFSLSVSGDGAAVTFSFYVPQGVRYDF